MSAKDPSPSVLSSLSTLVDASVDPIAIFDRKFRHVYVNDAVCTLMQRDRHGLLGARYDELGMTRANTSAMLEALRKTFETGEPQRIEARTERLGKRTTVFDILYHPCSGPGGEVEYVGSLSRDISALRFAEEDARQTAERLESLIDTVGVAILGLDSDLVVRFSNPLARKELEALGATERHGSLRYTPLLQRHPTLAFALDEVFRTGCASTHELSAPASGRPRRFQINLQPEYDGDAVTRGCIIVARDITSERQLQSQLHISERLASLGRIAAGVAHEISNPLTAVHGNLELSANALSDLIRQDPMLAPKLADVLDMLAEARQGSERIRTIVDDIGLLARDGDLASSRVALEDVVRTVVQMLGSTVRRSARLELELSPVDLVGGSAPRLVQVLSALVQNAVQAMPRDRPVALNRIVIGLSQHERDIRLSVTDNGIGIPPEHRDRLFDPFFTTRPVGEGAGLGLTVAHDIVVQHGGHLTLESVPDRSTIATIHLPIADD